jgi:NAD(P)-dependent dehydrogenase (short-subunit alcohol dehydrogenase family)
MQVCRSRNSSREWIDRHTSSLAALLGVGSLHAYIAAKGGVISLTRSVAIAYAKNKVR